MKYYFFFCLTLVGNVLRAQSPYVDFQYHKGDFSIASSGKLAPLIIGGDDYPGVIRAIGNVQADIEAVTGGRPALSVDRIPADKEVIIAGTIGKSKLIDLLIQNKRLDVHDISGKWEAFVTQVIEQPLPGVARALVIAGSDKRGTIFGLYDLSQQIGVSPWHWWADVPVKKSKELYILPGRYTQGEPAVKYRGIFLNDEEPSLGRWAVKNYGGFNHQFYEKLFELILRMKGNFLWPAMWWASFNSDDTLNAKLADEYGIVMSTSHHEPMMRAHAEWKTSNLGDWNYETNAEHLKEFWKQGIERMGNNESIVTLAMRGDGDMAMSANTNIALLEKIVSDQRDIIHSVTGKEPKDVPQVWSIYKEVQDYYDQGMKVPDDVTLLFCDDNWGNIRKLPKLTDAPRAGGYGIYYHFDYVGGPRNYKWLNTNQITKVYEQMHLANEYGANRIWIVNVGDLKPMELPIQFFLDYAWNPKQWNATNISEYTERWAEEQFGKQHASQIARILTRYTTYNARRKPELLSPETYSLINYREAETITEEYNQLANETDELFSKMQLEQKDAFYQLVVYPVKACANLNQLYVDAGKNHLYALQGRATTNDMAESVKSLFRKDAELSNYYNKNLANGKWDNMMNQVHIGYTIWQDPKENIMPAVTTLDIPKSADMAIAIEGSAEWWPNSSHEALLPEFNPINSARHYIDVFNRGSLAFDYSITTDAPWLKFSTTAGRITKETRIEVSVDWKKAPANISGAIIKVKQTSGKDVAVRVLLNNLTPPPFHSKTYIVAGGYTSIHATGFSRAITGSKDIAWKILPDYERTGAAITPFPVTAVSQQPGGDKPHLEYDLYFQDTASVAVQLYLGTTLNFHGDGLKIAVSLDEETPTIIDIHGDRSQKNWEKLVADNIRVITTKHKVKTKGLHVLKYWMVDAGVVLEKIVVDAGGVRPSYLGPPENNLTGK